MPITDLYITLIPNKSIEVIYPPERQAYINSASNEKLRSQRYFVWKLLEYALNNSFGLDFKKLEFQLGESGKWLLENCYFSLSHSEGVVAVAVSDNPIGLDIEWAERSVSPLLYKKILSDREVTEFYRLDESERKEYLIKKWTMKESVFKLGVEKTFHPKNLELNNNVYTGKLNLKNKELCFSVANKVLENLRLFNNIEL